MQIPFRPSASAQILVVGDVILDRYLYGETTRISPEAPVPVVKVHSRVERPGGAANVALNVKSLGVGVQLIGITGEDDSADLLAKQLAEKEVSYQFIQQAGFPTITKVRIMSQHQQLLRLDYESAASITGAGALYQTYTEVLDQMDVVVLSDYAKGSLQSTRDFIDLARRHHIRVLVDPKGDDFTRYRNASIIVPYVKELESVVGPCDDEQMMVEKGISLCHSLSLDGMCITRGPKGMTFINVQEEKVTHLSAQAREIFDVTGVGDTVVATMAAAIGSGYDLEQAAEFANQAASIVIQKLGTATVTIDELNSASRERRLEPVSGILEMDELIEAVAEARGRGERIVLAVGCFDIMNANRVEFLAAARNLGDRLLVAIENDEITGRFQDGGQPINRQTARMQVAAALSAVDWVIGLTGESPLELIEEIKPDILAKGGIGKPETVPGARYVMNYGGVVKVITDKSISPADVIGIIPGD